MKRILIVDDDYCTRELYKYVFMDLGYEVDSAKNGREGLEKVLAARPDCMIIDIAMPEMTGVEFARRLYENTSSEWQKIPFIVMTGESSMNAAIQYAFQNNVSCKAFLPKSTTPAAVAKIVQNILCLKG